MGESQSAWRSVTSSLSPRRAAVSAAGNPSSWRTYLAIRFRSTKLRGHPCAPLLLAGRNVDPPGVLLDNDAAVAPAEPAQGLG